MIKILGEKCVKLASVHNICEPSTDMLKADCIEVEISDFENLALAIVVYSKFIPDKIIVKLRNCDKKLIEKISIELEKYIPHDSFEILC